MEGNRKRRLCQGGGEETEDTAEERSAKEHDGGLSGLQETFGGSVKV